MSLKKAAKKKADAKKPARVISRITCGASRTGGAPYVGKTVSEIRTALSADLNIPKGAIARVAGKRVNAKYTFKRGDQLEFAKRAGSHG